jgi:hypothetical protein
MSCFTYFSGIVQVVFDVPYISDVFRCMCVYVTILCVVSCAVFTVTTYQHPENGMFSYSTATTWKNLEWVFVPYTIM